MAGYKFGEYRLLVIQAALLLLTTSNTTAMTKWRMATIIPTTCPKVQ